MWFHRVVIKLPCGREDSTVSIESVALVVVVKVCFDCCTGYGSGSIKKTSLQRYYNNNIVHICNTQVLINWNETPPTFQNDGSDSQVYIHVPMSPP